MYTASVLENNEEYNASESMVTDEDTSYNRRDGNQLHVEDSETGYSLALGHHAGETETKPSQVDLKNKNLFKIHLFLLNLFCMKLLQRILVL